jgi:hypothetical protein
MFRILRSNIAQPGPYTVQPGPSLQTGYVHTISTPTIQDPQGMIRRRGQVEPKKDIIRSRCEMLMLAAKAIDLRNVMRQEILALSAFELSRLGSHSLKTLFK